MPNRKSSLLIVIHNESSGQLAELKKSLAERSTPDLKLDFYNLRELQSAFFFKPELWATGVRQSAHNQSRVVAARQIATQYWAQQRSQANSEGDPPAIVSMLEVFEAKTVTVSLAAVNSRFSACSLRQIQQQATRFSDQILATIDDFIENVNIVIESEKSDRGDNTIGHKNDITFSFTSREIGKLQFASQLSFALTSHKKAANLSAAKFLGTAVLSGSFHPLHHGHMDMAAASQQILNAPIFFELPIVNAAKPPLDALEIQMRLGQDFGSHSVLLSNASTFVEKSNLYPGCVFVVGIDTVQRIGQSKYYENSRQQMETAINKIKDAHCRFLVFGRMVAGKFAKAEASNVPNTLRPLCEFVGEKRFRADVSSSESEPG